MNLLPINHDELPTIHCNVVRVAFPTNAGGPAPCQPGVPSDQRLYPAGVPSMGSTHCTQIRQGAVVEPWGSWGNDGGNIAIWWITIINSY